ncbi:MAG: nuclear transport factor 2 family protein [Bacteroidia bacterium]|nr:MAG: nuclear transport factor 2 family protein [Bacteroidia bacterium]
MKHTKTYAGLLALLSFIIMTGSCTQGPLDATTEIEDANKAFMEVRKSGDALAMSMLYTIDARILPSNGTVIIGREAIQEYWSDGMDQESSELKLETLSAISIEDMAIEEGTYKVYVGEQVVDEGKYMVTWKKEGGQWKLHQDIWNSDLPMAQARASQDETVWVVWNRVKADKVKQFEEFNFNYLEPAIAKHSPRTRNTVRSLRPKEANEDGTFTYFYLMDPGDSPDGYGMATFLTAEYGKEKSDEYMEMFRDCLVDGKQEWVVTEQTSW